MTQKNLQIYFQHKNINKNNLFSEFNIDIVDPNFPISWDKNGKVLSKYKDNIWDFKAYISNPGQTGKLYFNTRIESPIHIIQAKKIIFLLLLFSNGKNNSQLSTETLRHYFNACLVPLSRFAKNKKTDIFSTITNDKYLIDYIKEYCTTSIKTKNLLSLLVFLDSKDNKITKINFKRNSFIFEKLKNLKKIFNYDINQTPVIPSRIFSESLKQRWEQISEIENNINLLLKFLDNFITSERFATTPLKIKRFNWNCDSTISWNNAIIKYNLIDLFNKYKVTNRVNFKRFISQLQGTCKHLIHAYTGMRAGEVLSLKHDCLEIVKTSTGVIRLVSTTSKLHGFKNKTSWITSKEIQRIIKILNNINQVVIKHYDLNIDDTTLFINARLIQAKHNVLVHNEKLKMQLNQRHLKNSLQLELNFATLSICKKDFKEINDISFEKLCSDYTIGMKWNFTSHQYRRSIAVYAMQSGLISLGSLQAQLKHLLKEMTLYYSNGASFAKQLFRISENHIANDLDTIKPELDTLAYIKNVIFSDERLFGAHGSFVEKHSKQQNKELETYLLENREKTLRKFKNGDIAYKETALGGCISIEACNNRLTRSITACLDCSGSILKKSKINTVINKQKEFISSLDPDSIEYRTELKDLKTLEKLKSKLIKD